MFFLSAKIIPISEYSKYFGVKCNVEVAFLYVSFCYRKHFQLFSVQFVNVIMSFCNILSIRSSGFSISFRQ